MIKLKEILLKESNISLDLFKSSDLPPDVIFKEGFKNNPKYQSTNFRSGIYFGTNEKQVRRFGKYLYKIKAEIDEEKLYEIEESQYNTLVMKGRTTDDYVKKHNYEAVVVWDVVYSGETVGSEVILYNPEKQIKDIQYLGEND